ncbi:hypothetical protein PSTG_01380 [Puccinia striiformis f. sp. tritici PST-78]|uniref:Integrase catalytic domain-containing protein n=1 Tax=Puccinia striiformis f. sp. tritici PST-78 TaxID=1165861 RepID=A0A0L0W2T4_9BASI|nr:hypothetical protein PSTG_01380 [Puccinia striiformis f. sp. tritici PST-78]
MVQTNHPKRKVNLGHLLRRIVRPGTTGSGESKGSIIPNWPFGSGLFTAGLIYQAPCMLVPLASFHHSNLNHSNYSETSTGSSLLALDMERPDHVNSSDNNFSSGTSSISYPDCSDFPNVLTELDIQEAITSLVSKRKTGTQIHAFLKEECGVQWSLTTLNRRRALWKLRNSDLPKPSTPPALPPQIHASIVSSHQQRLTVVEICSRLLKDTGKDVSLRTVERYLASLQLQQRRDNIADGRVTRDEVKALVHHARTQLLFSSAGYRRVRQIIIHEYQIHVPRQLIYDLLSELDSQGMADRLCHACKRRVYQVSVPNHIRSADGHDKSKPYGITVYGFIDAWSRKILGMYAHVTNNDPMHVGVYFLQLVTAAGGVL